MSVAPSELDEPVTLPAVDVASVVARLEQLERWGIADQLEPVWLWERVIGCDVPRLRRALPPIVCEVLDELAAEQAADNAGLSPEGRS